MTSLAFATSAFATGARILPARARAQLRVVGRSARHTVIVAGKDGRKSLYVRVKVKEGKMDAYRELIQRHISACFMNDRCMYFDYGVSDDEPGVVMLYEVYEDADALKEHKESGHLKDYLAAAEELTDSHDVTTLDLAPYGSVNCNYAGECELGDGMWD